MGVQEGRDENQLSIANRCFDSKQSRVNVGRGAWSRYVEIACVTSGKTSMVKFA